MRRPNFVSGIAVVGLGLGVFMLVWGWQGLWGFLLFIESQSPRLLGGILVGLSIAVLIRQVPRKASTPPQQPPLSHTPPEAAPEAAGASPSGPPPA
jgi:hypothetical protein